MKTLILSLLILPSLMWAASVVNVFDAPDTGISGLAWDGSDLWAVDGITQSVYQLDPSDGTVISNFYIEDQTSTYDPAPAGATFIGGYLYVAMYQGSSYGMGYKYDSSGNFQSDFDIYC
ncbi:MAG: hypothetical protein GF388_04115 [Candidatus Aegiribacteria sp.]|nr:hypothetical protein [Candidatus Aegiribacteria sp.]MBD3294425.1 hypothetical protein [Candidatus Fermentibacteria bacterium]